MDKLNICIDIDGTITEPYYWIEDANKYFNKNIKPEDVIKYEIHEILEVTSEEYLLFYKIYKEKIHLGAAIRENSEKVLWNLSNMHNIYYVTAREKELKNTTEKWFKVNNLPNAELFLLGSHHKVNKAVELKCDIFIEDRYENALELAGSGFNVLLIDTEYNRKPLIQGIKRVYDWKDIENEISLYNKISTVGIKNNMQSA